MVLLYVEFFFVISCIAESRDVYMYAVLSVSRSFRDIKRHKTHMCASRLINCVPMAILYNRISIKTYCIDKHYSVYTKNV